MTNWTPRFMEIADRIATWSKDPSTRVGCVIVDDDHIQLSGGFNGFPRGISDNERLANREVKLKLIVHAEANAVAAAARKGHSLIGSTAYVTLPPCSQCAALLIQAGVTTVVHRDGDTKSKWAEDWRLARDMFREAGIKFHIVY